MAALPVLMSLHDDMTETVAKNIIAHRNTQNDDGTFQDFSSVADLKSVEGMSAELFQKIEKDLTVKAEVFEIHARSSDLGTEKAWLYVVSIEGGKVSLKASMQENDFLWVQPPPQEDEE